MAYWSGIGGNDIVWLDEFCCRLWVMPVLHMEKGPRYSGTNGLAACLTVSVQSQSSAWATMLPRVDAIHVVSHTTRMLPCKIHSSMLAGNSRLQRLDKLLSKGSAPHVSPTFLRITLSLLPRVPPQPARLHTTNATWER